MNYWLYITNSDNWEVTKKTNILGASHRHRNSLSRMKIGDKCLVYIISEWRKGEMTQPKIVGAYRVASEVFNDDTRIFSSASYGSEEIFDFRIKLNPIKIFQDPIDFKPLVPRLSFIKNKKRYSLHLMGRAIVEIPKTDYKLITQERV